ncbi:uncharacterized protein [Drosophila virilis]|uniref:uncharacterized protein n=1 Tax=Drosophila virilis TaxID=7244 RepID=UPI0038B2E3F1
MTQVSPYSNPNNFYLPHHAVFKTNSTTTKVRVVFNASSPSSNGKRLNDILHTGPVLQSDLIQILRWRFYRYVFNADITKMYRQIQVDPRHTLYQRILFRNENEELCDFELNTVTFGAHINEILGLKRVDSESASKLCEFSDKVNSHMRALQSGLEQISGCIIVHMLIQRLDTQTQTKWEEAAGIDKIPTADEFFKFLEKRNQRLESVQHALLSHITNYQVGKSTITLTTAKECLQLRLTSFCDASGHGIYTCSLQSGVVLLATAVALVKNSSGSLFPCRALLDSGSQLHMVTSRFAQRPQLRKTRSSTVVMGLRDTSVSTEGSAVRINMKSQDSDYSATFDALVTPTITDSQPSFVIDTSDWKIPSNISQNSSWRSTSLLAAGRTPNSEASLLDVRLSKLVRRFWEIESLGEPTVKAAKEEAECEQHFANNFSRLPSGEYSVRLPLKRSAELLGKSYGQAHLRFLSLERKLGRNSHLKELYSAFIKEFLDLNHMSRSVHAMHQLAFDGRDAFPIGSDAIKQEFYVDDLISGGNSVAEAKDIGLVFKAMHLELVKDLSTAIFLSAMKGFIATRGKPSQIWSNNATNFLIFCLLLLGDPSSAIIEPDLTKLNYDRLDGWQRETQLQQVFWARWREEYLTLLQQRAKCRTQTQALYINDMVVVKDENLPPMRWPLVRIANLIPGKDGVNRVADMKTTAGIIRRAVSNPCLLPLKDSVESQASNGGSMLDSAAASSN